jgi:uncharacterized protein YjbJ (UPF0337 family)
VGFSKENAMNREQVEGGMKKAMGSAKEAAGKATGNNKLRAEGVADKAAGAAKKAYGDVKDAAHKATK